MAVIEVIKYNGEPDVFAWKFPSEELGTWTQLIVNESQEAILFKGGKALDTFGSGRHTLTTANIPLLNKMINLPFGGRSPFTAEVWYINKAYNLDIKWGTPSPIQIQDPKYGIFAPVRSNGSFGIYIEDSKKFLVKLVGTLRTFDKTSILKYFRGLYVTKVKDAISSYLIDKQISILEINAYIGELSEHMHKDIQPVLAEYGIGLASFYVNDISVPEDDSAVKKLKDALSKRAEMSIIGYSYQQERSFNTLDNVAQNANSDAMPLMGAGMGLGMGMGMGQAVSSQFSALTRELTTGNTSANAKTCPKCHSSMASTQRYCGSCGFDTALPEQNNDTRAKSYTCSVCGAILDKDSIFCPKCGQKLNPCPNCGADIPDDVTVCPHCSFAIPISCPSCRSSVRPDARFCPKCGQPLVKQCPKCNAEIEGTPNFCPKCGEKL